MYFSMFIFNWKMEYNILLVLPKFVKGKLKITLIHDHVDQFIVSCAGVLIAFLILLRYLTNCLAS